MIIGKEYKRAIETLVERINDYAPLAELTCNRVQKALKEDALQHYATLSRVISKIGRDSLKHSANMEFPWLDTHDSRLSLAKRRKVHRVILSATKDLRHAWTWALCNYEQPDEQVIQTLAAKIDPEFFGGNQAPYRRDSVRILGGSYIPPRPEKVPREMHALVRKVQQKGIHPVDAAALLRFHLARIHPFSDVNGRTARMIQNTHLAKHGYSPVVIPRGEKMFYNNLLEDAVGGHKLRVGEDKKNLSNQEQQLYDYLAAKLIVSLETILEAASRKAKANGKK